MICQTSSYHWFPQVPCYAKRASVDTLTKTSRCVRSDWWTKSQTADTHQTGGTTCTRQQQGHLEGMLGVLGPIRSQQRSACFAYVPLSRSINVKMIYAFCSLCVCECHTQFLKALGLSYVTTLAVREMRLVTGKWRHKYVVLLITQLLLFLEKKIKEKKCLIWSMYFTEQWQVWRKKEELQASQAFYSMSFLTVYLANDAAG